MNTRALRSYMQPGDSFYQRVNELRPTFGASAAPTAESASGRPVSVRPSGVRPGTYNAQTLPLGDWSVAAQNYGVTTDNVGGKWSRIWANRTNKAGGSRQIFDKVSDWASPEKILARGGSPKDLQWQLMGEAIRTGRVDPRLKPELLRRGMGVGLSETARHQQHKKTFWDSLPGKILKVGGPIVAGAVLPGFLPAAAGGFAGAASRAMQLAQWAGRIKSGVDYGKKIVGP